MLDTQEQTSRKVAEHTTPSEVEIEPSAPIEPRIKPGAVMMSLPTDPPGEIVAEPVKVRPEDMNGPVIHPEVDANQHVVTVEGFHLHYGKRKALHGIDMKVA